MATRYTPGQDSPSEELSRLPCSQTTALQDATKLKGYHTLLFIKEEHHTAFEALATLLLFDILPRGTPSTIHITTMFLVLYGALIWPNASSKRNHLETSIEEERYQKYWCVTDYSPPAAVNGPVFSMHAAMTDPKRGVQTTQHPEEHQNRLEKLLWKYFEHLINMGRRGDLQAKYALSEGTLLSSLTDDEALIDFPKREDLEEEREVEFGDESVDDGDEWQQV